MNLHTTRRIVQIFSLFLFHRFFLPIKGDGDDITEMNGLCLPILSCHACPLSWTACPIGVLLHYSGWQIFPYFAIGTLALFGLLFGRLFCGWICPFGTLQALFYKIPSKKIRLPKWMSYGKYVMLILFVFLIPYLLGEATAWSFCRICPAAAIQVVIPSWFQGGEFHVTWNGWLSTSRFLFLAVVVVLAILSSRSFCKVFCPIGALMAPLNYLSFWKVKFPASACLQCEQCDKVCSTDVEPSERILRNVDPNRHQDCIVCHECQTPCPVIRKNNSCKGK